MAITLGTDPYGGTCAVGSDGDSSNPLVTPTPPALTEFTAMCWQKSDSLHTDFHNILKIPVTLFAYGEERDYTLLLALVKNDVGSLYHVNLYHYSGTGVLPDSSLPIDTWIHFTLTGDSTGYRVYVNGALVAYFPEEFRRLKEVPMQILSVYDPEDLWFDVSLLSKALPAEVIAWYYADRLTNGANSLPPGA